MGQVAARTPAEGRRECPKKRMSWSSMSPRTVSRWTDRKPASTSSARRRRCRQRMKMTLTDLWKKRRSLRRTMRRRAPPAWQSVISSQLLPQSSAYRARIRSRRKRAQSLNRESPGAAISWDTFRVAFEKVAPRRQNARPSPGKVPSPCTAPARPDGRPWLLHHQSPTKVGTYAYVNPVVAVALGHFVGGEVLDLRTVLSGTRRGGPGYKGRPV